jgi:hypothetical protein
MVFEMEFELKLDRELLGELCMLIRELFVTLLRMGSKLIRILLGRLDSR